MVGGLQEYWSAINNYRSEQSAISLWPDVRYKRETTVVAMTRPALQFHHDPEQHHQGTVQEYQEEYFKKTAPGTNHQNCVKVMLPAIVFMLRALN